MSVTEDPENESIHQSHWIDEGAIISEWTVGSQSKAVRYARLLAHMREKAGRALKVDEARQVCNPYALRVNNQDELREHLIFHGVETVFHYPDPQYLQQWFDNVGVRHGDCTVAESSASSVLSLPVYTELLAAQQAL